MSSGNPTIPRPISAVSSKSSRSWKQLFSRSKVEPDAIDANCKSVLVPLENGKSLRVLHSVPDDCCQHTDQSSMQSLKTVNEKRVIFFIHGVGGSAELWKAQILFFSSIGYETIAPDLLGHGKSSKPSSSASYEFDNLSQLVLRVFDMFKGKRNILVGHSYGASFVTLLASERSYDVSKIVLISGGPPTPLKPEAISVFCLPLPIFAPLKPIIVRKYRT